MDYISAIRAFTQVARRESFSAASRDLNTAASVVSRYVKELESDLGVRLLTRTTRKVSLTEAGQNFLLRAQALLDDFDAMRDSTQALHSQPSGRLRITAPLAMGQNLIAPLLPEFMKRYPQLSVSLHLTNQVVDLVEEGWDLAVRFVAHLEDSSLVARRLGVSRSQLCVAPEYAEEFGIPTTPDELMSHSCVLFCDDGSSRWELAQPTGEAITVKVNGRLSVNSMEAAQKATLGGIGISLLPEFLLRDDFQTGALLPLLTEYEPPATPFYIVYPQRQFVPMKVRCFIDFCIEKLGES
ncbi:LysR family transcriptional regulator [Aliamphritea ceti]|uniref:LysR family transcriptional regulator n=1 Tax=Aliamphritea ceti TaxID=1524258 RepID=UPI0021C39C37|nr:LysR family transcriptional regulator [Aliamphritea ceti]